MRVQELADELLRMFPAADAEPWDRVGLSVGDPEAEVRRVACALDATVESILAAQGAGCDVLLTHHPVSITPPELLAPAAPTRPSASAAMYEAVRLGVSVISLHTNLDRSLEARDELPGLLGLTAESSLEFTGDPARRGLGAVSPIEPCSLEELALCCERAFGTQAQVWGQRSAPIRRVALMGGSLGDFGDMAINAGCDCVIAGELGYHRAQDLSLRGLSVILLGHDRSEQPFCRVLAAAANRAGVARDDIHIIPLPPQWWAPVQGGNA